MLVALLAACACACTESQTMTPLDSSKYFSEASTAGFVDDIQRGKASAVRDALKSGQDPNVAGTGGIRPIHFVFAAKSAEVADVLLSAGADPNAKAPNGNTPLHYAVQQQTPDFTQVLLKHRADPRIRGEVDQPVLYLAISSPVAETILPLLVKAGADVNGVWGGYPPLQAAMVQQDWPSAVMLLKLGASPDLKTKQGKDAVTAYCDLLARMQPVAKFRASIYAVGELLKPRGLPPACMARLEAFR